MTSKKNTLSLSQTIEKFQNGLADRSMEEDVTRLKDYYSFLFPATIPGLIDSWTRFRNTRHTTDLETPEWKQLEQAYMKHLEWRFEYPKKIYQNQIKSAWFITGLVIVLVLGGLCFSFLQMHWAIEIGDLSKLNSEILLENARSITFRSSLVGATVLFISLLFFYLYVRNVYPIKYQIPPHVKISDTDAEKVFKKRAEDGEEEVDNTREIEFSENALSQ